MRPLNEHREHDAAAVDFSYQDRAFGVDAIELWERIRRLRSAPESRAQKIGDKLRNCCRRPQVIVVEDPQRYYLNEQRCKSRVCPRCAKIRARALAQRIKDLIHEMDAPRFLTLTCRSNNDPLADQITQLRRWFGTMRRGSSWKDHVSQGVYTIEITWSQKRRQWHPHLHAIIDGVYYAHQAILDEWESIVGDQAGVDIRAVHGVHKLANYLSTYVAKTCDLAQLPPEKLAEWAVQTHGLRLAQTFGRLQACKPQTEPPEPKATRTVPVDVNLMAQRAANGDRIADQALRCIESDPAPCDQFDPATVGGWLLSYIAKHAARPPTPLPNKPPNKHRQLHLPI